MANEFASAGGRVIGISQDLYVPNATVATAREKVERTMADLGVRYPILILEDQTSDALNERLRLPGPVPCTIALDATGKEVDREEQGADLERFRAMMRRALGK